MKRLPPRSTRTDPLFPYTPLFRSLSASNPNAASRLPCRLRFSSLLSTKLTTSPSASPASYVIWQKLRWSCFNVRFDRNPLETTMNCKSAREHNTAREDEHRSEERRVGKECVSTCRSRGTPSH